MMVDALIATAVLQDASDLNVAERRCSPLKSRPFDRASGSVRPWITNFRLRCPFPAQMRVSRTLLHQAGRRQPQRSLRDVRSSWFQGSAASWATAAAARIVRSALGLPDALEQLRSAHRPRPCPLREETTE